MVLDDRKYKIKVSFDCFWTEPSSWRGAAASWLCLREQGRERRLRVGSGRQRRALCYGGFGALFLP